MRKQNFRYLILRIKILSLFLTVLLIGGIVKFLKSLLNSCINKKILSIFNKYLKNFKYSFFLRFWIQNYFDIGVACGITLMSSDLKDLTQAYSFFFASLLSVIFN